MKEFFKERVNYTREGKYYIGYLVNLPQVIAQAETKEELIGKLTTMSKVVLKVLSESIDRGFELRKFELDEWTGLKR